MDLKGKILEWTEKTKGIERLKSQGNKSESENLYKELERRVWASLDIDEKDGFPISAENYILIPHKMEPVPSQASQSYQFNLSLEIPENSRLDRQHIVDESWEAAQASVLSKAVGSLNYGLRWSPKDFNKATKFPGGLSGKVEIRAFQSIVQLSDKTNSVFGPRFNDHDVIVETRGPVMKVEATGLYRRHLGKIVTEIAPQIAILVLSPEDAERLIRKEKQKTSKDSLSRLEKSLVPNERSFSASLGSEGLAFSPNRAFELAVSVKDLGYWEEVLCKPLASVSPYSTSGIKYFQKSYGPIALCRGQRLRDLQNLAERIEEIDLGVVNYDSQIGDSKAKELLGRYLERVRKEALENKSWNPPENLNGLLAKYCGSAFARRIGWINSAPDERDRVLSLLKEKGYNVPESIPSGDWWSYQPGIHLVEFLRQQHEKYPSPAIDAVKKEYRNRNYGVQVRARVEGTPLAKLNRVVLPSEAVLYQFDIDEWQEGSSPGYWNRSRNRLYVESCGTMFNGSAVIRCSIDLARPALLGSQETALRLACLKIS